MTIEDNIRRRIEQLIEDGSALAVGNEHGRCRDKQHSAECRGWFGSTNNVLCLVCPGPNNAYRKVGDGILQDAAESSSIRLNHPVGDLTELLKRLLEDIDDGLLASVANQARAETFDDLLDHAQSYLDEDRKEGSGVLASAVFEDTIRRIGEAHDIVKDKLDAVITALAKQGVITSIDAKGCRLAAGVRNEALHANWEDYELADVKRVIEITREFLKEHLAR